MVVQPGGQGRPRCLRLPEPPIGALLYPEAHPERLVDGVAAQEARQARGMLAVIENVSRLVFLAARSKQSRK